VISLCCPTRGRPDNVLRFVMSAIDNADQPNSVECIFYVDEDDPTLDNPLSFFYNWSNLRGGSLKRYANKTLLHIGDRILLSECTNVCSKLATGEILGYMGDDIIFRTKGWDTLVKTAFDSYHDKIALVYGRDGYQDEKLATHGFISRKAYEILGYLVPPHFVSDYSDTWLFEIYQSLGRLHYISELYTEHMHPIAGKADWDQTHKERLARGENVKPWDLYAKLLPERLADFQKLKRSLRDG